MVPEAVAFPGYPSGIVVGNLMFLSGLRGLQIPASPRGFDDLPRDAPVGQQGFWLAEREEEEVVVDAWSAHDAMDRVLAAVGSSQQHVLRMRIWQRDKRFYPAYERVRFIRQPNPSPSSGHCADPVLGIGGRSIGLDGVAIANDETTGARELDGRTHHAAPTYYSLIARHGSYAFLAGHTPVKQEPGFPTVQSFDDLPIEGRRFATGRSHTDSRDGPIAAQAWYIYDKLGRNLQKIGGGLHNVVHCLIGLRDLRDLAMFHRVHRETFGDRGPALTIVGAGEVGHRDSRLVVEPTAYMEESAAVEWRGPAPLAAPLARRAGNIIFLSGMLAIDDNVGLVCAIEDLGTNCPAIVKTVARWGDEAFAVQCWQVWSNLASALGRAGSSLDHLVKISVFLADPGHWPVFEAIRAQFLTAHLPAIEAVVVPHPGPNSRFLVQIDAVAATTL
jgi:enamine deaminase RidA (YjgF/YER057c/UK114 family)